MDKEIRVLQFKGSGNLQVFVDGVALPEADAAAITREFIKQVSAGIPGGVALVSAIEGHRAGGLSHAHVVEGVKRGH